MGKFYEQITAQQTALIEKSALFVLGSVSPKFTPGPKGEGPLNVSPKGGVKLHVIDDHTVAYLDYAGSASETSRHLDAKGPVTVMVMSFEAENAAIVRLYGTGYSQAIEGSPYAERLLANGAEHLVKERQIIVIEVERTQTSCGYGVPIHDYVGERSKEGRGRRYKVAKSKTE